MSRPGLQQGVNGQLHHLNACRLQLRAGFESIKADFYNHPSPRRLFKQHCQLVDGLLASIWLHMQMDEHCCLIAVGGYGRGELYPYSDIDLLILLPDTSNDSQALNQKIESLVGRLWDVGLHVGNSVRTLSECMIEAKKDLTVQTNLMESRYLSGDKVLYEHFLVEIDNTLATSAIIEKFYNSKLKEQNLRHARFNDTAYNLEPNIKESPGGLRDLHTIEWVYQSMHMAEARRARVKFASNPWAALVALNILTPLEARKIKQHQLTIQTLRIRLHFLSNRREDRLLFDFQNALASELGYVSSTTKRASEQLMQSYYRSAKFISLMNEILLKSLQQRTSKTPVVIQPINQYFEARNQLLEATHASLLQQRPAAIFEAFLLLQQHPELNGMGSGLLRNLQRVKKAVNRDFRQNPTHKKLFIEILSQPNGVNHALRAMNRYGILGAYIPAFGKIIGQMQHDLFHVYTVDEHILNVLANLRRFAKPELKHEFPLCSKLFATFDAPHILYIAALFHDIAKGRGGDHSTLGMVDAARFCKMHGLPKADCAFVSWLVEAHLKMSSTAQKSDLSDPSVIANFALFVNDERRLTALYLLTVADIRGTSPLVWNAWKARLLENLYHATKSALNQQGVYAEQAIARRKLEAAEKLNRFGLSPNSYEPLWTQFGSHYFIRYEADEIAWQSRLLTPHLYTTKPIVRARLSPTGEGIQVMIYTRDQINLFAKICNFFDQMNYSIVEAKIHTTDHHYALNNFVILDESGKSVRYSGLFYFIETELTKNIAATTALDAPLRGRISRQVKHMPIEAQFTLTEETDSNNHQLEIVANDRPGLLATIAHHFLTLEIELHNAKINTLGNRAEDTFLISAKNGQKLDCDRLQKLKDTLISHI